jgi:hypothetical protein
VALANLDQLGIRRVLLEEHHVDERDQQVGSAVLRSEKFCEINKNYWKQPILSFSTLKIANKNNRVQQVYLVLTSNQNSKLQKLQTLCWCP